MQKTDFPFRHSWLKAADFLGEELPPLLVISLVSLLLNFPMMPSLFLGSEQQIATDSLSSVVLLSQFVAIVASAWLTMFVWVGTMSWFQSGSFWKRGISVNMEEAFWATPGYLIFSIGYSFLLLLSFAALVFPVFYVGPRFLFFPYLSALGLVKEESGRLAYTFDRTRGQYFSCLFFFSFFVLQQFYFAFLDQLVTEAPFAVVFFGLVAISFVGVFFEAWACLFICELIDLKGNSDARVSDEEQAQNPPSDSLSE